MASFRDLPRVDEVAAEAFLASYSPAIRTRAAQAAIAEMRNAVADGREVASLEVLATSWATKLTTSSVRRAINATGVILHTGLGRSLLADHAIEAVCVAARRPILLEIDEVSGKRGDRQQHVRGLLTEISGAEDALVVNNCAGAVILALAAIASRKEVILSRGQMVEIGGSFRLPEIVKASGCKLIEVGCTNKTHLNDYTNAITIKTAAILRCHPSNFQVTGFHHEPTLAELSGLAQRHSMPLIDDLGSGNVSDWPLAATVRQSVERGGDLVCFSGDKLLGGPQAGIMVGKRNLVSKLSKHPLARALRIDKLNLAALESTLSLYRQQRTTEIPLFATLGRAIEEVEAAAQKLAKTVGAQVIPSECEIGSGAAPGATIPSFAVVISLKDRRDLPGKLRLAQPAILGRVKDDALWLDMRTVSPNEVDDLEAVLVEALQ